MGFLIENVLQFNINFYLWDHCLVTDLKKKKKIRDIQNIYKRKLLTNHEFF